MTGPRKEGSIGFSVIRGGGIIGDHDAQFISEEEILSISHRALDRAIFAKGALRGCEVGGRPEAGLYICAMFSRSVWLALAVSNYFGAFTLLVAPRTHRRSREAVTRRPGGNAATGTWRGAWARRLISFRPQGSSWTSLLWVR